MTGRDDADGAWNRRRFLAHLGAGAVATGLAGCQEVTNREFAALPAGLGEAGTNRLGLSTASHERIERSRTVGVGGAQTEFSTTSHLVTYRSDVDLGGDLPATYEEDVPGTLSVGVLATPSANIAGAARNPLATRPLDDLVAGETGRRLLRQADVVGDVPEWDRAPERVGETTATLFGSEVEVVSYYGRTAGASGADGEGEGGSQVLLHLARGTREGAEGIDADAANESERAEDGTDTGGLLAGRGSDTVVVGGVEERPTVTESIQERLGCLNPDCTLTERDLDRLHERLVGALETVTVCPRNGGVPELDECMEIIPGGGSTGPQPDIQLSDVRLVQTVEKTRVVGGSSTYTVDDPDIVAGDYATVAFDATVDHVDLFPSQTTVEITWMDGSGRHTDTYTISKADAKAIDAGVPMLGILHNNAHDSGTGNDPTVFEVDDSLQKVELSAGWNVGSTGEVAILEEGRDFDVSTVPTFRVGFVQLWDRADGSRYGDSNGQPMQFRATVDRAVQYVKRVLPGKDVTAYRASEIVTGRSRTTNNDQVFWDMKATKDAMDQLLGHKTVANGAADVVEHSESSDRAAFRDLRSNGFDAVVCIVPGNDTSNSGATHYFNYHTGNQRLRGRQYTKNQAMAVLEAGDPGVTFVEVAGTTAHEIGHHLVDDAYQGPTSGSWNHPMAQRDDDGTEVSGSPAGIDYDHARHTSSNNTNTVGYFDAAGVVSKGYDLTDGTFTLVNGWGFDGSGDFDVDTIATPWSHDDQDSYMSYSGDDDDTWTDSRLQQHVIEGGFSPGTSGGPLDVLSALGQVDEEGRVSFDSVSAYLGYPTTEEAGEGDEGDGENGERGDLATVEFLDPAGEVRHSERVDTTVEASDGPDVAGVVDVVAPFAQPVVSVRTTVGGMESELNPIVASVRDAVGRLDERAVPEDGADEGAGEALRREFGERLDRVAGLMADGEYRAAADAMRAVAEFAGAELRATDGAALNDVTRSELVDLAERMVERLEVAAEVA